MNIEDFIDQVVGKDFTGAESSFKDVLGAKVADALQQEKIAVAGTLFGEPDDDDVNWDDEDEDDDEDEEDDE
jgi:hypothetical protein